MSWQQLFCQTSKQHEAAISQLMEENGAVSVTYQDAKDSPILEPLPGESPLWDELVIIGLFETDKKLSPLIQLISQQHPGHCQLHTEILEEQQWERSWMDNYHPMKFGENLWIYPTHHERPDDNSTQILLDPGLAFGTGTHPTTALCLEWLDQHPPRALTGIDYGCGSGVLAIAAIKLGAHTMIATDIDQQALTATQNNMCTNHINNESIYTCLPENLPKAPVDLILANILSGPLVELAPDLAQRIKPQGRIVLSGILHQQKHEILDAYSPWFDKLTIDTQQDWLRVTGIRNINTPCL